MRSRIAPNRIHCGRRRVSPDFDSPQGTTIEEKKLTSLTLAVSPELCTGCRACELACSYHHKKKFARDASSVYIERVESNLGKGFEIMIYDDQTGEHLNCDMCNTETLPLCVKFCSSGALTLQVEKGT